jgi:WD40 repeat protein
MMKEKVLNVFLVLLVFIPLAVSGGNEVITLKTEKMDDVIGISSFFMNGKGEIFLFSSRMSRIFKFKPDGTFEKSFCQKGEGPGEITRVFSMYHNPKNDCFYLPEFYSMGKGRVTIYDSDGNYKGLLKPDISRTHMDRIIKLAFLKNGSYFLVTRERVGWKPVGKLFKTQEEILVRYFNEKGLLVSEISRTTDDGELSHAVNWGGPGILFAPSTLVKLTPDEQIAVSKNDNNEISIYNVRGEKVKTIKLNISREKLSDIEFKKDKEDLVNYFKRGSRPRMLMLAKKMIKLEYKPFYRTFFLTPEYIILSEIIKRDESGYPQKNKLISFSWKGEKKGEKVIEGIVMNISNAKVFIESFDEEGDASFRIEPCIFDFDKKE